MKLTGLTKVLANLNREIKKIEGASLAGLWDAGLQIQRASQLRCPVDTGNLKASHYTRNNTNLVKLDRRKPTPDPSGSVKPTHVEVGATANYAMFVHENMEANFKVGGPKFLEHAISDNQNNILEIIRRRAAV